MSRNSDGRWKTAKVDFNTSNFSKTIFNEEGEKIGWINIEFGKIHHIEISPKYQGLGYGTSALKQAIDYLKICSYLEIKIQAINPRVKRIVENHINPLYPKEQRLSIIETGYDTYTITNKPEKYTDKWTFTLLARNMGFSQDEIDSILNDYRRILTECIESKPQYLSYFAGLTYKIFKKWYSTSETESAKQALHSLSVKSIFDLLREGNFFGLFLSYFNQGSEGKILYEFLGFLQKAKNLGFEVSGDTKEKLEAFQDSEELKKVSERKTLELFFLKPK